MACVLFLRQKLRNGLALRCLRASLHQWILDYGIRTIVVAWRDGVYVLYTALLEWISEYAVRAYTTADSAVSYLNHARIARTTPSFALRRTTAAESCENTQ